MFSSFHNVNQKKNLKRIQIVKIWDLPLWSCNNGGKTLPKRERLFSSNPVVFGVIWWGFMWDWIDFIGDLGEGESFRSVRESLRERERETAMRGKVEPTSRSILLYLLTSPRPVQHCSDQSGFTQTTGPVLLRSVGYLPRYLFCSRLVH